MGFSSDTSLALEACIWGEHPHPFPGWDELHQGVNPLHQVDDWDAELANMEIPPFVLIIDPHSMFHYRNL